MDTGVPSPNLPRATTSESLLVNSPAGTSRQTVQDFAMQLVASEPMRLATMIGNLYETAADLPATTAQVTPWVINDPDPDKIGIYKVSGGIWVKALPLPYSILPAEVDDSDAVNARRLTTRLPIYNGVAVIIPVVGNNTASPVTVSFDGGETSRTIKTAAGADVPEGSLTAGMKLIGIVQDTTIHLVSDASYDAVMQARLTAATQAKDDALQARGDSLQAKSDAISAKDIAEIARDDSVIAKLDAQAAAEASGPIVFYDTYALAFADLAGLADGIIIEVGRDETRGDERARYRKEDGAFIFKVIVSGTEWRITSFGAKSDGSDCAAAAQDAVDFAAALFSVTGKVQVVIVPPGLWCFASKWGMATGVTIRNDGTIKWIGANTEGHFLHWGGTDRAWFLGGRVDCNGVGNTNAIAIGGMTENTNFYIQTEVVNCVSEPTADKYAGGGKAVTLQHGALSGFVDVIAKDGSIGLSTEGISPSETYGERAARNVRVRMVCEHMAEAGWLGQGSLNGGIHGNAAYLRNHGLDLDLTLVECGLGGDDEDGPIILQMCTNTRANIRLHNTSARTPQIVRGTHRDLDLRVHALVSDIKDVINTEHIYFSGVGAAASCVGSKISIDVAVEIAGATGSILTGEAASPLVGCDVEVGIYQAPNAAKGAFDLAAADTSLIDPSTRFRVVNRSGGAGNVVLGQTPIGGGYSTYLDSNGVLRVVFGVRASETSGVRMILESDPGLTALADDAAIKFTPPTQRGVGVLSVFPASRKPILIGWDMIGVGNGPRLWVEAISTVAAPSNAVAVLDQASAIALTGTSGTDGTVTISASGGYIYVENRSGGSLGVQLRPLPDSVALVAA